MKVCNLDDYSEVTETSRLDLSLSFQFEFMKTKFLNNLKKIKQKVFYLILLKRNCKYFNLFKRR